MHPLVGWGLGGPTFTPRDVPSPHARIGEPTWGPAGLLRELEMRMGLPPATDETSKRVPLWCAWIRSVVRDDVFYAKSFEVDDLGTAATLLQWRDALVDAGWDGNEIPEGGPRLSALAAIEVAGRSADEPLPLGMSDRLVRVEAHLTRLSSATYDALTLVEPRALWSVRWQRIFARLEALGVRISQLEPQLATSNASTDLALLQTHLRGETPASTLRGDGSLVVLRGDTSSDLAELTASLLAADPRRAEALVVRPLDPVPLESALRRHNLPAQGYDGSSAWRPAMQILPLAVELSFAPRDPYRVLELLTLPHGPFRGVLGERLARAVARQPGIDGQEWRRQKEEAAARLRAFQIKSGKTEAEADEHVATRLARVAEWIEGQGAGPEGATKESLLAITERVQRWIQPRVATEGERFGAAYAQANAFASALRNHDRKTFTKEEARYLLDQLARSASRQALSVESAGRIPHVTHPSALLASRSTVVVWGFVAGAEASYRPQPWTAVERAALDRAGIALADPKELLRVEADAWRRAVLCARDRLVLVIPSSVQGDPKSPHPLWDEIAARLGLDDRTTQLLTRTPTDVLASSDPLVPVEALAALPLPEARGVWSIAPEALATPEGSSGTSATALEKLASCPLSWVLEQRARLRSGAIAKVASGPLLFGSLTHRLVEELHREAAFSLAEDAFVPVVRARFGALLEREGATLLLDGASFERVQLTEQVVRSMRELHRYLGSSGYRIAAVEEAIETTSAIGTLRGRLDVRLVDDAGRSAILDLKWGASTYKELLEEGRAVQLAVYARAVTSATNRTSMAPAAYFALAAGKILAADERMKASRKLDGPPLTETLSRVEETARAVVASHGRGKIYVAATKKSVPLLAALGVAEAERERHFGTEEPETACKYCAYDALCGRRWEVLA